VRGEQVQGAAPARTRIRRPRPEARNPSADIRRVEDTLRKRLQTDVRITARRKGRGAVTIHYYSNDDLARVLELILGEPFGG
jgi:ParB-like chromosome segregation protein Spo0J